MMDSGEAAGDVSDPSLDAATLATELLISGEHTQKGCEALVQILVGDSSAAARDSAIRALLAFAASAPDAEQRDMVWEALARSIPAVSLEEADWLSTDPLLPDCIAALARTLREASQYSSSAADPKRLPRLRMLSCLVADIMKSTGASLQAATSESSTEYLVNSCKYMLQHDDPLVQAAGVQALRICAGSFELVSMAADLLLSLLPRLGDVLQAVAEGLTGEPRCSSPAIEPVGFMARGTQLHRGFSGDLGDDEDLGTSSLTIAPTAVAHTTVQPGGHPPETMPDGLAALRDLCRVSVFRDRCLGLQLPEVAASVVGIAQLRGLCCEFWEAVASTNEDETQGLQSAARGGHWFPAQDGGADVWISEDVTARVIEVAAGCNDVREAVVLTRLFKHWIDATGHQVLSIPGLLGGILGFVDLGGASTVELQLQCLLCIGDSVSDDSVRGVLLAENGLTTLSHLLRSASTEVVVATLGILTDLCVHDDIADEMEAIDAAAEHANLQFFSVFATALLPSSALHRADSVVGSPVLKPAVRFLAGLLSDQRGEPTSRSYRHCRAMADQGIMKPLLSLLDTRDDRILVIDVLLCLRSLLSNMSEQCADDLVEMQACALFESVIRQATDETTRAQELARDCLLILGCDLESTLFFDSGGLRALRSLVDLPDSASRVMATRWMKHMALSDSATLLRDVGLPLLFRAGFDHQRLTNFDTDSWTILTHAMASVSAMIDDAEFQLAFCNDDGLGRAIAVRNALQSMATVVAQEMESGQVIEAPPLAPPPVLNQDGRRMSTQEAATIQSSSSAFADWLRGILVLIIGNRDALPAIVDGGGASVLIDVLADGQDDTRQGALQALIKLSASRHLCEKIATGDACERIFLHFNESSGEEQLLLLEVLANLLTADGRARSMALDNREMLDTVHHLFSSGTAESTASKVLCVCIENLRSSVVLAHRWWLPFLLGCLDNHDVLRPITAAKLAELSPSILGHPSPQPLMIDVVHVQTVFRVVESGSQTDAQLRVDLVLFLQMLSRSKQHASVLLDPQVASIHHLVSMLKKYHDTEPTLLTQTFSTLTNLLSRESAVATFCSMNGLKFLLGLLSTRDLDLLEEVARALSYCTRPPSAMIKGSRRDSIDFGSSPTVAGLLADPTALSKLVVPLRDGLVKGSRGGVSRQRGKVRVRYLANLWKVLANLFVVPEVCSRFVEDHDGVRLLISYLRYDVSSDWHVRVQTAAAEAMDVLSSRQPHLKSDLVDAGALNAIFAVLSDPRHCIARTSAVTAVVNILSSCAEEEALCRKLVQRGTAEVIAPLLSFGFVARNAALVLFNVSCFRANRIRLLEAGVHEAMLELMEVATEVDHENDSFVDTTVDKINAGMYNESEPAFWSAFTLANLIDVAPSDEGTDALFQSWPSLREAEEWLYTFVRNNPPERQVHHRFPPPQFISNRYLRSNVGVCQHLGLWCAAHMTFQRATYWTKWRPAFVGSGLLDRLALLLHAHESSGTESESSIHIKMALRNAEAVEVTRFPHVKVGHPSKEGRLQKQGHINRLSWRPHLCTLVRGRGLLLYEELPSSSTGSEQSRSKDRSAATRSLYLLAQAQGQERGMDAVRANEDKRLGCFEVRGYATEDQALAAAAAAATSDGNIDDGVTTLFLEAESTEEMYAWILAIRRELILRDREAVPSSQTGGGNTGSSVLISESSGLAFRHYSLEHRELLCDDCVAAGRTPKGFAVMPDQLQPIGDAARDAARRASHVLDTSYDLRDIFVSASESMLKSNEESKERSMHYEQVLSDEVGTLVNALEHRQQLLSGELLTVRRTEEENYHRKITRLEDVVCELGHQLAICEHVIAHRNGSHDGSDTSDVYVNADDIRILKYEKSLVERLENLTLKEQLPVSEPGRAFTSDCSSVIQAIT